MSKRNRIEFAVVMVVVLLLGLGHSCESKRAAQEAAEAAEVAE